MYHAYVRLDRFVLLDVGQSVRRQVEQTHTLVLLSLHKYLYLKEMKNLQIKTLEDICKITFKRKIGRVDTNLARRG